MIRVLHVFGGLNRGGAETMIMNIYRNIDRSKIQFDFVVHTDKECDYFNEIKSFGGKIFTVPKFKGSNFFQYINAWNKMFENHSEYKIIHGHVRSTASIYLSIAKKFGLRTIAHSHSVSSGSGFSALVKNILQIPIRFKADYLFACSLEAGKWLFGEEAVKSNKFKLIKNAIDINKYKFDMEKRSFIRDFYHLNDKYIIGHVGRFHPLKNHEFLIDVFNVVSKMREDAVLLLIGDGELQNIIAKKIKKMNLEDKVVFTGAISNVHELMQAMDVFVFPSQAEGLGMVVIEAQASGLKCVVSDNIPNEAFISEELIEIISLDTSEQIWAERISNDPKGLSRINNYEKVKMSGYDIEETSEFLEEFYAIM